MPVTPELENVSDDVTLKSDISEPLDTVSLDVTEYSLLSALVSDESISDVAFWLEQPVASKTIVNTNVADFFKNRFIVFSFVENKTIIKTFLKATPHNYLLTFFCTLAIMWYCLKAIPHRDCAHIAPSD